MFKLQTPLIVLDLEATAGKDSHGFQTNDYIIDLGAVYLDENLQPQGEFSQLVKPLEPVTEFITKLTTITNDQLSNQPDFRQVGQEFSDWTYKLTGNIKKVRLVSWGTYFDIPLLRRNYQNYGMEFPFSGTAIDAKSIAFLWLSLSGRRTDKISLEFFSEYYNIPLGGIRHRAFTDAKLTAEILCRLWSDLQGFFVPQKEGEAFKNVRLSF